MLSRTDSGSELLDDSSGGESTSEPVWMSHFDAVTAPPEGFAVTAVTPDSPAAVIEDIGRRFYGVQHHPEVAHTPSGQTQLERFLHGICQINSEWTMTNVITESVEAIRAQVGAARAVCGLSGGVDSAVLRFAVYLADRGIDVDRELTMRHQVPSLSYQSRGWLTSRHQQI